jgi:flavodoxin
MKKYLVVYFTNTGNSKFLAEQIATSLHCDIKRITTTIKGVALLYFLSSLKFPIRINIKKQELEDYEEIIILGPIWGGLLIAPLKTMIKKCISQSKSIHFAVSCETREEDKNGKYGYVRVLEAARKLAGPLVKNTEAFSTALVISEEEAKKLKLKDKTLLRADNFKGSIKDRLDQFIQQIKLYT